MKLACSSRKHNFVAKSRLHTTGGGVGLFVSETYNFGGGHVCWIETDGEGLHLGPTSGKGFETVGNGLYLMKQSGLCDGRGLILVPDSQFKNIPILGMIL